MNIIDILASIVLAWCLWSGWRNGILVQLSGIIGILLGAWVAFRFSHTVGEWLDMEELPTEALFILVLVVVLIGVIVLCRLLTKLLKAGGLALPLRVLGVAFAVTKGVLILGLLILAVEAALPWISHKNKASFSKTLKEAYSYSIIQGTSSFIFPYIAKGTKTITQEFKENVGDIEDIYPTIDPVGVLPSLFEESEDSE